MSWRKFEKTRAGYVVSQTSVKAPSYIPKSNFSEALRCLKKIV